MTESIKMLPAPSYLVKRKTASIIKAYENDLALDRPAAKESQSRTDRSEYRRERDRPFSAKVRRKWSSTKAKVSRRFGMYGFLDPLPLGLYIDMMI